MTGGWDTCAKKGLYSVYFFAHLELIKESLELDRQTKKVWVCKDPNWFVFQSSVTGCWYLHICNKDFVNRNSTIGIVQKRYFGLTRSTINPIVWSERRGKFHFFCTSIFVKTWWRTWSLGLGLWQVYRCKRPEERGEIGPKKEEHLKHWLVSIQVCAHITEPYYERGKVGKREQIYIYSIYLYFFSISI